MGCQDAGRPDTRNTARLVIQGSGVLDRQEQCGCCGPFDDNSCYVWLASRADGHEGHAEWDLFSGVGPNGGIVTSICIYKRGSLRVRQRSKLLLLHPSMSAQTRTPRTVPAGEAWVKFRLVLEVVVGRIIGTSRCRVIFLLRTDVAKNC